MSIHFRKGHGTGNDFIVLADPDDELALNPAQVAALCHRRTGIGADGLLKAVRRDGLWFMDYRNADGSFAEMCGNGARVFATFLKDQGLEVSTDFDILTRGGVVHVSFTENNTVVVDMGPAVLGDAQPKVVVDNDSWVGKAIFMPNPHCVVNVNDLREAGTLHEAPQVSPEGIFPDGVNVEFVTSLSDDHIAMRVHERGSGETLSCGTGACAAAVAHKGNNGTWSVQVDVPGGTLFVNRLINGHITLEGPAQFTFEGTIDQQWLESIA